MISGAPDNHIVDNMVASNGQYGVMVVASGATGNRVEANAVGVDPFASVEAGNGRAGISFSNGVDGQVVANIIAHNAHQGIRLTHSSQPQIESNAIWDNGLTSSDYGEDVQLGPPESEVVR